MQLHHSPPLGLGEWRTAPGWERAFSPLAHERERFTPQLRRDFNVEDRSEKHIAMENRLSPMRELFGELLLEANKPQPVRSRQQSSSAVRIINVMASFSDHLHG